MRKLFLTLFVLSSAYALPATETEYVPSQALLGLVYGVDTSTAEIDSEGLLPMNFLDDIDEYVPGCQERGTYKEGYAAAVRGTLSLQFVKRDCKEATKATEKDLPYLIAALKGVRSKQETRSHPSRWVRMQIKEKKRFDQHRWAVRN